MRQCRSVLLVVFAALAACEPPGQTPAKGAEPPFVAAPSEAAPSPLRKPVEAPVTTVSLAGDWRVAGIDGQSLDEPVGLSLTGDEQQLWWQPRCAGVARAYRVEGGRITFAANQPPGDVCDIGLPRRLDEVVRALDNAASISRTPNNGVLISGPEHSVLLFSQ